jgi:hypothetical protein
MQIWSGGKIKKNLKKLLTWLGGCDMISELPQKTATGEHEVFTVCTLTNEQQCNPEDSRKKRSNSHSELFREQTSKEVTQTKQ